jgi:hypothetical protein
MRARSDPIRDGVDLAPLIERHLAYDRRPSSSIARSCA